MEFKMKLLNLAVGLACFSIGATQSLAAVISVEEFGLFASSPEFTQGFVQDTHVFSPLSDFDSVGWDIETQDNLGNDNFGSFTWKVTNNSGVNYSNITSVAYLDAAIDEQENTFFNESAVFTGNTDASSWEADEPGFQFGDIYDNAQAGSLDNSSSVGVGNEDDPSLALGFEINDFMTGDWFELTFEISEDDIGGLFQFDPDSNFGFYFNASLKIYDGVTTEVLEPSTLSLLGLGVAAIFVTRRRKI